MFHHFRPGLATKAVTQNTKKNVVYYLGVVVYVWVLQTIFISWSNLFQLTSVSEKVNKVIHQ